MPDCWVFSGPNCLINDKIVLKINRDRLHSKIFPNEHTPKIKKRAKLQINTNKAIRLQH
jgi:hypothetical protein